MKTLLAILRLVRFPLLFTALADVSAVGLLRNEGLYNWFALGSLWLAASSLYVFGMAGNDLMDRNRDRLALQSGRKSRVNPISAGLISTRLALVVTVTAAVLAIATALISPHVNAYVTITALAMALIYNSGAKRFPPVGLLLLALIRAGNAAQSLTGPDVTQWWLVSAVIGLHVLIVSAFAYAWERKQPPLYGNNWYHLLMLTGATFMGLELARRHFDATPWPPQSGLWIVILAYLGFLALFVAIFTKVPRNQRGGLLMYIGLSWLVVLDGAFILAAGLGHTLWLFGILLGAVLISGRILRRLTAPRSAPKPVASRSARRKARRRKYR